jgi:DNA-binding CsgD family transcriptional regulator
LDVKTLEKLRKIWAMRGSPYEGEVEAAKTRAEIIVKPFGYALADVDWLLRAAESKPAGSPWPASKGREEAGFHSPHDPMWAAAWWATDHEKKQSTKRRTYAPESLEVIRRYGGLEKARSWQPNEQLLRAAVLRWSSRLEGRTQSIAGISLHDYAAGRSVPKRVLSALSTAYPLPATITEAAAEYEYWRRRRRDLQLVADFEMDEYLDFPCTLRWRIVEELLENGLRANSIAEILLRFRHRDDDGHGISNKVKEGVLKDLEHFAALEKTASDQFEHPSGANDTAPLRSATERRAEVKSLLSQPDTAQLSDREIARRVGVSPQTVGNIRRRM